MEQLTTRYLTTKRRLFEKAYGARLNPPQCQAVFRTQGPLLVLAGAGSGKTTVLVRRISYIIRYGDAYHTDTVLNGVDDAFVDSLELALKELTPAEIAEQILPIFTYRPAAPWQVLAITFTNKAAREIKERLTRELGDDTVAEQITAGTFHSVCVRFLRQWGERVGYRPGFTIYDTDDKKRLVVEIMKELNISDKVLPPKTVCNVISNAKDNLISPEKFVVGRNPRDKDILRIYEAYQARLMEYNALDFDDIIMKTVELLEEHEDARRYYTDKFHYVCVDEYQDTNHAQFRLTQLLSSGYRNIMVVGDDDQSIYAFRGATVANILQFDKIYDDCHVIKLEQNYRSTKRILDAANAVISNNEDRHAKNLWCDAGDGELIHLAQRENQNDEAWYITNTITGQVARRGRTYRDFAVLYRVNEMARALEGAFTKSGIPYRVLGGQRFYDRKEIRDMVAYLYVVLNRSDDQRLKRIVNEPKRGIGGTTIEAVELIAHEEGTSMFDVMSRANQYTSLSRAAAKLIDFTALISRLASESETPSALLNAIFERTGYHDMLIAEGEVSKTRIDAIEEFVTAAKDYEEREEEPTLMGFMEEVALVADVDKYDESADAVVLMTIHSAKGLEFPVVFLPGMEEGIFPGMQASVSPTEMGEERRLAYVAITRAKEELYMSYTRERMMYGRTTCNPLSRFVQNEIPETLIFRESDYPRRPPVQQRSTFAPPRQQNRFSEMNRRIEPQKPSSAASYGIEKLSPGTRVSHPTFGTGTILTARDMGGDMLYTVAFDSGAEKKLMATFARLQKI